MSVAIRLGMKHVSAAFVISLWLVAAAHSERVATAGKAAFDPMKFFTGRTRSSGVFENRRGEPTQSVVTETSGRIVNGELRLEQDLYIGDKPRQHRSWKLRRLNDERFDATANDLIGTAHGRVRGDIFSWTFTLALQPGNPLLNVSMTQYMYLQPGGQTLVNRSIVRKFGIQIASVTEQFQRR